MSTRISTVKPDLQSLPEKCPNCGMDFTPVEYYTASFVSSGITDVSFNTVTRRLVYNNVTRHVGGVCRWCIKENRKRSAKTGAILSGIGLVVFILDSILTGIVVRGEHKGLLALTALLSAAGIVLFVIGLVKILRYALNRPDSGKTYLSLYDLFIDGLNGDGKKEKDLTYMSRDAASRLTHG